MVKLLAPCGSVDDCPPRKTAAVRIFETARDLFYRRGVRAVGVDEIVCEAGVTKPSLYRAYKSKDELVVACLRASAEDQRVAMSAALEKAGPDPREQLRALFHHYAEKVSSPDFRGCSVSNVAVELAEPGHPGREIAAACKENARITFGRITRDLGIADPDQLTDSLILVIEGAMSSSHVFGSQGPAKSLFATCEGLTEYHLRLSSGTADGSAKM